MQRGTRAALFLGVCVPLRLGLAYLPVVLAEAHLRVLAVATAAMAAGTLYLALSGRRLHAPEGGGTTWWASYRLLHGALLLAATAYLAQNDRLASVPLLLDVLVGIVLFFTVRDAAGTAPTASS